MRSVATDHRPGTQHIAAPCPATCAKPSRSAAAPLLYLHAQCLLVAPTAGPTATALAPPALPSTALSPTTPPPQIYAVCQSNGRIAYKRAGGSRLITHNEHWKSQIRHALYTGERFQRCASRGCWSAGGFGAEVWRGTLGGGMRCTPGSASNSALSLGRYALRMHSCAWCGLGWRHTCMTQSAACVLVGSPPYR